MQNPSFLNCKIHPFWTAKSRDCTCASASPPSCIRGKVSFVNDHVKALNDRLNSAFVVQNSSLFDTKFIVFRYKFIIFWCNIAPWKPTECSAGGSRFPHRCWWACPLAWSWWNRWPGPWFRKRPILCCRQSPAAQSLHYIMVRIIARKNAIIK